MFQSLASILTVSVMLLHSILGCCSHHAHACEHGHAVENCAAWHDGNEGEIACHGHQRHHGDEPDHGLAAHDDGHGDHESHECPHGPCGHECQGGNCTYTQSPKVKTPALADGRLWFPLSMVEQFVSALNGSLLPGQSETGPPDALATCCCRPMTQVWRL
ncbi:hypothetical protein GC176_27545 [bacterium]|nr:hypothetical protein [bacterium]